MTDYDKFSPDYEKELKNISCLKCVYLNTPECVYFDKLKDSLIHSVNYNYFKKRYCNKFSNVLVNESFNDIFRKKDY
jgi:hypothetical protein